MARTFFFFVLLTLLSDATSKENGLNEWSSHDRMYGSSLLPKIDGELEEHTLISRDILPDSSISAPSTEFHLQYKDPSSLQSKKILVKRQRLNNGKFKYDPALIMMGLGKKKSTYDPALYFMGLGKRRNTYDTAVRYKRSGKRKHNFDPGLRYMGLGKRFSNGSSIKKIRIVSSDKDIRIDHPVSATSKMTQMVFEPDPRSDIIQNVSHSSLEESYVRRYKRSISKYPISDPKSIDTFDGSDPSIENSNEKQESPGGSLLFENSKNYPELQEISKDDRDYNLESNSMDKNDASEKGVDKGKEYKDVALKNSYDFTKKIFRLGKRTKNRESSNYDPAFHYMGLGKRKDGNVTSERQVYDLALPYMKVEKQNEDYNSKRATYDPAFKYMGLGKRQDADFSFKRMSYDPALKYMGLGKRKDPEFTFKRQSYDPALQYMGLGKRQDVNMASKRQSFDPALQYMGLGKRNDANVAPKRHSYDPALQYMGLGKREDDRFTSKRLSYDPALQYMGLGKRNDANVSPKRHSYDPALQYMGLGKREDDRFTSKRLSYDPALQYMGLGKRNDANVAPKRHSYDPALQYMGLGKREDDRFTSKRLSYDPALQYMGLGKRNDANVAPKRHSYDPALQYMGLGKREDDRFISKRLSYDPALQYMGLGKRNDANVSPKRHSYDPALQYMGLGKREDDGFTSKRLSYDPALQYMGLGKRNDANVAPKRHSYDPALQYMGLGKRNDATVASKKQSYDPALQYMGLGKRNDANEVSKRQSYDPALQYMGLGKRENEFTSKRQPYDPALLYMGLGKRGDENFTSKTLSYDPALLYMGNEKPIHHDLPGKSQPNHPPLKNNVLRKKRSSPDQLINGNFDSVFRNAEGRAFNPFIFDHPISSMHLKRLYTNANSRIKRELKAALKYMRKSHTDEKQNLNPNPKTVIKRGKMFQQIDSKEQIETHNKLDSTLQTIGPFEHQQVLDSKSLVSKRNLGSVNSVFISKRVKRQIKEISGHRITPFVDKMANKTDFILPKSCASRKKWDQVDEAELGENFQEDNFEIFPSVTRRDERPRYNPGWVFIGLGKRSSVNSDARTSFFNKCYFLLAKINDAIMKLEDRAKKKLQMPSDPFAFMHKKTKLSVFK